MWRQIKFPIFLFFGYQQWKMNYLQQMCNIVHLYIALDYLREYTSFRCKTVDVLEADAFQHFRSRWFREWERAAWTLMSLSRAPLTAQRVAFLRFKRFLEVFPCWYWPRITTCNPRQQIGSFAQMMILMVMTIDYVSLQRFHLHLTQL